MNFKCLQKMVGNTCAMQTREWNNVYYDVRYYSVWFRFVPISNSVLDTVDVNFTSQDEKYRVGFCKNPFDRGS
jgi:hypothetical protein